MKINSEMIHETLTKRLPVKLIVRPFQEFVGSESASSVLLLVCTALALVWANSPFAWSYYELWNTRITVQVGGAGVSKALLLWINDGLMAIFFLLVGLEIKREVLVGELSLPKQAALPAFAAVGGMIFPAAIFYFFNQGAASANGWAIPMATDIAFALGVLTLLGNRIPLGLKIFVTALAIVDDLGAVLVIAFAYTAQISTGYLLLGAGFFAALLLANFFGARGQLVYWLLGAALWYALLKSGVHATVAGVLTALAVPSRPLANEAEFKRQAEGIVEQLAQQPDHALSAEDRNIVLQSLDELIDRNESPLYEIEHNLQPVVAFGIMPIFALANAGVTINAHAFASIFNQPIGLGVVGGLIVGKLLGVLLFSFAAVKLKIAVLPEETGWQHVFGAALLCGIGFTMSLFVAGLAFVDAASLDAAKIGILTASLAAGALGSIALLMTKPRDPTAANDQMRS